MTPEQPAVNTPPPLYHMCSNQYSHQITCFDPSYLSANIVLTSPAIKRAAVRTSCTITLNGRGGGGGVYSIPGVTITFDREELRGRFDIGQSDGQHRGYSEQLGSTVGEYAIQGLFSQAANW